MFPNSLTPRPLFRYLLSAALFSLLLIFLYHNRTLFPRQSSLTQDDPADVWEQRAAQVKHAFLHAYSGYEKYAAPFDELLPLSNSRVNNFNGWGLTAFDSLDTMLLMGLDGQYQRALVMVKQANFTHSETEPVPYFETVIRYLGGLLSAYALSGDRFLVERADEMATKLAPVFKSHSGLPYFGVNPANNVTSGPEIGILAEIASLQLEYYYLAKVTGKKSHFKHAHGVMNALATANLTRTGGMHPMKWNITSGVPVDTHISVGAQADSAHEYLLKHYLMTAREDKSSLEMYIRATTHIITDLLYLTPNRHLLYVTDAQYPLGQESGQASHIFEHLSCYFPGLLALGAHMLPLDDLHSFGIDFQSLTGGDQCGTAGPKHERVSRWNLKQLHMWAAEGLAQTCWLTYADQPTGLGPDEIVIQGQIKPVWNAKDRLWLHEDIGVHWLDAMEGWKHAGSRGAPPGVGDKSPVILNPTEKVKERRRKRDYLSKKPAYLLRPETVESLYILWRVTGDSKWRARGWEIFKAIRKETITSSGFATLRTVEKSPAPREDSMPSYFLAETLKYLYLMFKEEDLVPFDKYVFNTEAHPFPVFKWTEEERTLGCPTPVSRMSTPRQGEFVGSLDCGTTSVRYIIFDKYANIVAQHQLEFPQYYPSPGWHEHDADEIQHHANICIKEGTKALEASGWAKNCVKVLGITNQRETAVAWSRKTGKPLCKAIVWDDSRTKNTVVHFENKLKDVGIQVSPGLWKKGVEGVEALRDLTGLPISTYFSAIKLRWMIDHYPQVAQAHESDDLLFGTVESWVAYNLLGGVVKGIHISEVTNASRTLLLNSTTLQWEPCLLDFFGLRSSILPRLVSTSEVYGHIANGPLVGVPIGGLVGDQQGALIGNKCLNKGEAKCTYGTGAFLLFCTGSEIVKSSHGLLSTIAYQAGPNVKPIYALEGSISVAGSAIKWLRDTMKIISSAAEVNELAAKEPTSAGLYFVTAFSGLLAPYWDPGAAGLLIGISQYTNPSHIARATLEANAFQTRAVIESMKLDSGSDLKNLKVDGGMTNGDLVMQILADVGGFSIIRPEMRESTALGSALLAGSAINLFGWDINNPDTLSEVNTKGSQEFTPHLSEDESLRRYQGWKRAVERSRDWDKGVDE
ncbi:hypothetical protein APHAL10511_004373 [Amanita phalloides]|nr:hypothetical protein APHAL10511_004373 [Amanita phalloides]